LLLHARIYLGEDHEVIAEARPLAEANPLCEELSGILMLALYRCHRRAEALSVFRVARMRMLDNLGVEPMEELRSLGDAILLERRLPTNAEWLSSVIPAYTHVANE
jgi:DNA-binding SARP family transcriptional activator